MGMRSLPVQLGVAGAARLACVVMAAPQVVVDRAAAVMGPSDPCRRGRRAADRPIRADGAGCLRDPRGQAAFYNATGTTLYVLGMLVSAFALALDWMGAA